jgi:DNA-binding CsgD family transcriptional regulator
MPEEKRTVKKNNQGVRMDNSRNIKIKEARDSGKTLKQVGEEFGMSRERVRQIIRTMEKQENIPGGLEAVKSILTKLKISTRSFKKMTPDDIASIEGITEEETNILLKMNEK